MEEENEAARKARKADELNRQKAEAKAKLDALNKERQTAEAKSAKSFLLPRVVPRVLVPKWVYRY